MSSKNLSNDVLFRCGDQKITDNDIVKALRSVGLADGDLCFVHTDIAKFGVPNRALIRNRELLSRLIKCFQLAIGDSGTLAMPAFSYSFCKDEPFILEETPTTVGVLNEYFRKMDSVLRSPHPIFSICAIGPLAEELVQVDEDSFGEGSCFANMNRLDAKIVTFGTDLKHATYFHYPEQMFGVPYRFLKKFSGTRVIDGVSEETWATFNVRHLDQNVIADTSDESQVSKNLYQAQLLESTNIGTAPIRCGRNRILSLEKDSVETVMIGRMGDKFQRKVAISKDEDVLHIGLCDKGISRRLQAVIL